MVLLLTVSSVHQAFLDYALSCS